MMELIVLFVRLLPYCDRCFFDDEHIVNAFVTMWRTNVRQCRGRRSRSLTYIPKGYVFRSIVDAAHWCADNYYVVFWEVIRRHPLYCPNRPLRVIDMLRPHRRVSL